MTECMYYLYLESITKNCNHLYHMDNMTFTIFLDVYLKNHVDRRVEIKGFSYSLEFSIILASLIHATKGPGYERAEN